MATDPRVVAGAAGEAVEPRVPVVCLVGSSRFKHLFHQVGEKLEKRGCLVLMMSFFAHADDRPVSPEERAVLARVDRRRIDLADEVVVIDGTRLYCPRCWAYKDHHLYRSGDGMGNKCCPAVYCHAVLEERPYIGEDSRYEVVYATAVGKPISYYSHRKDLNGKADQVGGKDPRPADDTGVCIGAVTITTDPPELGPAQDAGKDTR